MRKLKLQPYTEKDSMSVWACARNSQPSGTPPAQALPPESSAGVAGGFPGDKHWDGPLQMPSDESRFSEAVVEQSLAPHPNSTEQAQHRKNSLHIIWGEN